MAEKEIGLVTHYFGHIGVAGMKLSDSLSVGDTIHIVGHTTDLTETIQSIQIEHETVETAAAGAEIGLKVTDHVREHDKVFKVVGG